MSNEDPFAQAKTKAVSWKGVPDGTVIEGVVDGPAQQVQSRDYDTGKPAFWDEEKTQPKFSAVVNLVIDGKLCSLWAQIPSALFSAIANAQSKAGQRMDKGGRLSVTLTHREPNKKNPRLAPSNQFTAVYTPPVKSEASLPDDPWASSDEAPF